MINIFEVFLPQLLRYPNPSDPLNGEAASLLMREPQSYEKKVREYVKRFATDADYDHAERNNNKKSMSPFRLVYYLFTIESYYVELGGTESMSRMPSASTHIPLTAATTEDDADDDISSISTFSDQELADEMDM